MREVEAIKIMNNCKMIINIMKVILVCLITKIVWEYNGEINVRMIIQIGISLFIFWIMRICVNVYYYVKEAIEKD